MEVHPVRVLNSSCDHRVAIADEAFPARADVETVPQDFRETSPGLKREGERHMIGKRVGILLFDDVEVLDFCGPFEVFSATRLHEELRREEPSPFEVVLIAETKDPIITSGGMKVLPDFDFSDAPRLDILVVPGGWGTRQEMHNVRLLAWVAQCAQSAETVTSVCTGSLLLGKAGLLDGKTATTHWRSLGWMQELFPSTAVDTQRHFVRDGNLFTSAGISAGMDMALMVVASYFGETVAKSTARHMEYPFPETDRRRIAIPETFSQ
jgi:transcriptional regulator GlxA family with amidase domain